MVISLAQVVAALATGAMLTIAVMLVLRLHGPLRDVERDVQREAVEEEREIAAAVQMIEDGYDLITSDGDDRDRGGTRPYGAVAVRSKKHLDLLIFGAAAGVLAGLGGWLRDAWGHPARKLAGQVVTGATVGAAATAFLLTPSQNGNHNGQAPYPQPPAIPTASGTRSPGGPATSSPTPVGPLPTAAPSAAATPGPAPEGPSVAGGLTVTAPAGTGTPGRAATHPGRGRATPGAPPSSRGGQVGREHGDGTPQRSGLCAGVSAPPLPDSGVCLLGSG